MNNVTNLNSIAPNSIDFCFITDYALNQKVKINDVLQSCHFITLDHSFGDKLFGVVNNHPRVQIGRVKGANGIVPMVTDRLGCPLVLYINQLPYSFNGVPPYTIAVARWTNNFTPVVGDMVSLEIKEINY